MQSKKFLLSGLLAIGLLTATGAQAVDIHRVLKHGQAGAAAQEGNAAAAGEAAGSTVTVDKVITRPNGGVIREHSTIVHDPATHTTTRDKTITGPKGKVVTVHTTRQGKAAKAHAARQHKKAAH